MAKQATRPYAGQSDAHPDPAPAEGGQKRLDKLRAMAPALIGALITGNPLPAPERTQPVKARPVNKREAARLRKAKQRERQRERDRILAEQTASRLETLAEHLAPQVLREAIYQGTEQKMIIGPRVQIVNGRAVLALSLHTGNDPIANIARESSRVSLRHERAARELQRDWNDVGAGLGVGAMDYLRTGGGSGEGGHTAMKAQIVTRARLDGAMAHMGALAPCVSRVALDCIPVSVWAKEVGKTEGEAMALVVLGLTRLADFYWPPKPENGAPDGSLTIGPPRSSYTVNASSEIVVDMCDMLIADSR